VKASALRGGMVATVPVHDEESAVDLCGQSR
jgi:hypothetical protein